MRAIGIDLGTTNSASAVGGADVRVLPTRAGEQLTPSVVSVVQSRRSGETEIVVGRAAANNALRNPLGTVFSVKRLIGRCYGEAKVLEVQARSPMRLAPAPAADAPDQGVRVMLGSASRTPVELSAEILRQVKADAELALGEPVTHAVITVPAYFEERQRKATADAGAQAGLEVLAILDEPTAAAVAFGIGKESTRKRVLVYDLGGGTFDISIIEMTGGQYSVLEIQGDNWLGGDDFDRCIMDRMVKWVRDEHGLDAGKDPVFLAKAKVEAEKAKIALSSQRSVDIFAPLFARLPDGTPVDVDMSVSLEDFEADIRPMVDRTLEMVRKALANQNLTPDDISDVLLVGGATSVPCVHRAVVDLFGPNRVRRNVNPMECVALGAGIVAAQKAVGGGGAAPTGPDVTIHSRTAMHLGISAVFGNETDVFVALISKGTPYPLREPVRKLFYPARDHQDLIRVPIYEGLSDIATLNEQQGVIELPLRHAIAVDTPIEISMNYGEGRVLTVSVRVVGTGEHLEEVLRRDRPRVVRPPTDSILNDWREDLQPSVRTAGHFLETYGSFLTAAERAQLDEAVKGGERALAEGNENAGRQATRLLRHLIVSSGVASQLFVAEGPAMQQAQTDAARRELAQGSADLRRAYMRSDPAELRRASDGLRTHVALAFSSSRPAEVGGGPDLEGKVRVKE